MKKNKISLFVLGILFMLTSCETLKEPTVEYGPVYPLSGEWIVRFIKPNPTVKADTSAFATVTTFNASDNSTNALWIRKTGTSATTISSFTVKSTCDVATKTFSGANLPSTVLSGGVSVGTCTVTQGSVVIDGWNTNSGHKSDKITFKIVDSRNPGVVYSAEGYRRTGWYEDEP